MESTSRELAAIADEIRRFIAGCAEPALLEPGEAPFALPAETHSLTLSGGRLAIEAWDDRRTLHRRVLGIRERRPGRLELEISRLGNRRGKLFLLDQRHSGSEAVSRRGGRQQFRERFRRFLHRQFPGCRIERLSSEPDLEHTLSPVFPRALIRQRGVAWAAIGAPPDPESSDRALAFGLIWLDYLRNSVRRSPIQGLILLLPAGRQHATCLRLQALDPKAASFLVYVYTPDETESPIDPQDFGNITTRLSPWRGGTGQANPAADDELARIPDLRRIPGNSGDVSYRFRGLEIACRRCGRLLVGIDRKRPVTGDAAREIRALVEQLRRFRSPASGARSNPLFSRAPENWLESSVRDSIQLIDPALLPEPVYGQVPAVIGGDRGVLDLLAVTRAGLLVVIELKASADLQLPLQALDYWLRVRYHGSRGDLERNGYFPGIGLSAAPPRLLLVAPSLEFHPTTEVLLRYFDPAVPVERVGLAPEWRKRIRVVFRLSGAVKPGI